MNSTLIQHIETNKKSVVAHISTPTVLFVIDTLQTGGSEVSLLENIVRFTRINAVVVHIYKGDELKGRFQANNIPVYSLDVPGRYSLYKAYRMLNGIINRVQPDLVVAYLTRSEIVSRIAGRINKVPVVGTFVSELYSKEYNRTLSFKARIGVNIFKTINRLTAPLCKGFVANSQSIKTSNSVALGIRLDKVEVIHRGRNASRFYYRDHRFDAARPVRFLNVGRLVASKNQETLVRGFALFEKNHPGATLHIAGEGPLRNHLENLVESLGLKNQVVLAGTSNRVHELMHEHDALVSASASEGFSGTLVEAALSGIPILAGDIGPNREIIEHHKNGYLFNSHSAEEIATAMQWFTENPEDAFQMAKIAHRHCISHFSIETQAAAFETYLLKMISAS